MKFGALLMMDAVLAVGSGPVHVAVTLVLDKGSVPRTPVSDVLIK